MGDTERVKVVQLQFHLGDTKQESKSGAIAIEAAVTGADVRSPPPPAGSLIKEGPLLKLVMLRFCF